MISVQEAKQIIKQTTDPLRPVTIPLLQATGLIAAENIYAPIDIPSFHQSAMDGYAFLFDENTTHFSVTESVAAGSVLNTFIQPAQAVRIFTGAALPEGVDTVLIQEKAIIHDKILQVNYTDVQKNANVRYKGSEIKKGDLALAKNTNITPGIIGFLASLGITEIMAIPKPSVAIIVTGNELQKPGTAIRPGKVFESNSYVLRSALQQLHLNNISVFECKDDLPAISITIGQCITHHDIVLITGGISVGDFDYVAEALAMNGVEKLFHKIRQKPGKPLFFGKKEQCRVFGLPGNPASVLTCFYEYVTIAIEQQMQLRESITRKKYLKLSDTIEKKTGLTHFMKAYANDETVQLLSAQESFRLSAFTHANAFAVLDENKTIFTKDELVEVHFFPH